MNTIKSGFIGFLTILLVSATNANEGLLEEQSIRSIADTGKSQFLNFLNDEKKKNEAAQSSKKANVEEVINALSSVDGLDGISSSLTNFLPDFQFASLFAEGDPFGGQDQVKVNFGYFLFDRKEFDNEDNNTKLVALVNRNSMISPDIVTAFGEDVTSPLSGDIGSLDDIEFQFSYTRNSKVMGRSLLKNRRLFSRLAKETYRQNALQIAQQKQEKLMFELLESPEFTDIDIPDGANLKTISDLANDINQKRRAARLTKEIYKVDDSLRKLAANQLISSNMSKFGALISNQPQTSLTLKYRSRDDLVGADEVELEFRYEFGLANLNKLRKKVCGSSSCDNISLEAYQSALKNDKEFMKRLESNDRFSFSLSYSDISDHRFSVAENSFFKKGGSVLKASASYGRTLTQGISRIDVGVNLEEFSDDDAGNDRLSGGVTYTHRLSERLSLPITLEFANKSEFLSDESSQFGGHIGFKWNFVKPTND